MIPEQQEKVLARKTMDELMAPADEEGIELPDEALDMVWGGRIWNEWEFWDDPNTAAAD